MRRRIGERIQQRLDQLEMSQAELARRCGLAQSTINGLIGGRSTSSAHLHVIARELSVTADWLAGATDSPDEPISAASIQAIAAAGAVMVPLVDVAFALGAGSLNADKPAVVGTIPLSREWLRNLTTSGPEHVFVARGEGDSMVPTILDGDHVIVDRNEQQVRHQDRLWALAYGDLGMIKRVRALPGGRFSLLSDNAAVSPIEAAADELTIVGRVVGVVRRV